MPYPLEHLLSQRRRVTSLPLMAFYGGLGEMAPAIDWETRAKAWDVAQHHSCLHCLEKEFDGNEEAFVSYLKEYGGFLPSTDQRIRDGATLDNSSVPGLGR